MRGAIYHVMSRGDRREPIFKDDEDRRRFVSALGETCAKTGWQVHAYCLMGNHFHLVVETPRANLVAGMLRQKGWTEKDLKGRRKGDRQKARMAARLRAETTMAWAWIAERLAMGHWRTAVNATRSAHSQNTPLVISDPFSRK
jgi:REP element-mobilizing transposase RayT